MASLVKVSGPLFDGRADAAVRDWLEASTRDLADKGAGMLRAFPMNKTGRAHGAFQAHIHVVAKSPGYVIPAPKETGVTWGPWLEGVTQRNQSTRFKGYHLFRKTRLKLAKEARPVAQGKLDSYIGRMGGTG